jgi:hypothetical protein
MRKTLLVPALLLLLPAGVAGASSLPEPTDDSIVVPRSLAGIRIGMPAGEARASWGGDRGQCGSSRCKYGDLGGPHGGAVINFREGRVSAVVIASVNRVGAVALHTRRRVVGGVSPVLTGIRTQEGIGIGSKLGALKKAYGKGEVVRPPNYPSSPFLHFAVAGRGKQGMVFVLRAPSKKVSSIILTDNLSG